VTEQTSAVVYAAKGTEDKHGSISTQIEDAPSQSAKAGR
jgi:hypothetical protein